MEFIRFETALTWVAVLLYIAAGFSATVSLVFKKAGLLRWFSIFGWTGLAVHAVPIISRWVTAGHGPYYRVHEVVGSDVWVGVLFFLALTLRYPMLRTAGAFVMPVAYLLLAWATIMDPLIRPLPPTFKSIWLVIHIIFAKLSIGSILVAFGLSVLYLVRDRSLKKERPLDRQFWKRLPAQERMDDLAYRYVAFGFIFLGVMIVAGSIWAQQSWGRYWSWDPVETWSLVAWFLYGLFLHLRITYKFKGARSAWMIILILVVSLIYHFGVPFISVTIHEGTTI